MKTILIADDAVNMRILVHATLDGPQYHILKASDGLEALELAQRVHPDLIILDWMMPGMSGIDVATVLRQDPETASIPVIMLTAKSQEMDKKRGEVAGVAAYLVKPFSPLELVQRVEQVLQ